MEFKAKHILVIAIIIILGLISFIVISIKTSQNIAIEETKEYEINENIIGFNSYEDTENLIMQIAIKDGNWSNLLLTDNFKSKYNEKDGVLGKIQFDKIEYKPYNEGRYSFEDRTYFVITQGLKKTAYTFNLIGKNGYIDDIKYFEIFDLTDENGQELDAKVTINSDNFTRIFHMLSIGGNDERSVAVTPNFHQKYPYFLDIFEHYSPLKFNNIKFVEENSSWERKEAYFIVDSILECKKRKYLVEFALDKRGYLDDVDVKMIKEENYENKDKEIGYRVFYINSNWDGLSLTENFRKKFNSSKGIFPDIELLGYNFDFDSNSEEYEQITIEGIAKINQIRKFKINNIFQYYLYQVFKDENGNTDNVIYEKLPYVNIMSIEEAKELYLKENKE